MVINLLINLLDSGSKQVSMFHCCLLFYEIMSVKICSLPDNVYTVSVIDS